MDVSSDPYEQKLYQMFTSHDVDARGSLDKESLSKLCKTLELKDREPVLVACLLNGNPNSRVTFKGFKEGLLKLLGTDLDDSNGENFQTYTDDEDEDNITTTSAQTKLRNTSSPSREVSPKFVVAGKKYGRRSRPPSAAFDSSPSESDNDYNNGGRCGVDVAVVPNTNAKNVVVHGSQTTKSSQKVQRSSSHSDLQGHTTRKRRPASGSKLKRCASLPAQQKPKKEEKPAMLNTQLESSVESLGNLDFENLSHSLYDVWNDYGNDTDNYLTQSQLEQVCERVGLTRKIAIKVADEVFEKLGLPSNSHHRISFNDFIALIQTDSDSVNVLTATDDQCLTDIVSSSLAAAVSCCDGEGIANTNNTTGSGGKCNNTTKDSSSSHEMHAHTDEWPVESSAVPIDVIIDMWDAAGILNSRSLLDSLGFQSKEIRISQLSLAIDDDLQSGSGIEEMRATPLLRASLALHKAEVNALQQAFRQLATQNKKLHSNNRDINRRAALLAQEVDERHAHLENSARSEIRQLEQRHADIVRELTIQMANDREQWTNMTNKLEHRIKSLEADDAKLRQECQCIQDENSALETEQISLQKQVTELLEENIKLNNEIVEVGDKMRTEDNIKGDQENEELLELIDRISALQMENANLRDKNDELVSEVEEKSIELTKLRAMKKQSRLLDAIADVSDCADFSSGSLATKRRGDSPSKAKISEESPKLGKLRKCSNEINDGDSEGSGDWIALNSELNQSAVTTTNTGTTSGFSHEFSSLSDCKDEEIKQLKGKVLELEAAIVRSDKYPDGEFEQLKMQNFELESSLEQMRKEFEDLEDYWQGKLTEERQLFETEQQKSNDKFDELLKKMGEYEEQFLTGLEKDGRLSPIEEKFHLEQQYAELEAETEEIKCQAREMLEKKSTEIAALQEKIKKLQHRVIESVSEHRQTPPRMSDVESPASSPISYLWHQSTIQAPARDYQNPNWNARQSTALGDVDNNFNLTNGDNENYSKGISPIQRPCSPANSHKNSGAVARDSDASSVKSFTTHSVASTHSIHKTFPEAISISPNHLRDEIKQLKLMELELKDGIQELSQHRDCLVMELQQLQEAKPVLEKAYARTSHPSLLQRISQLEQKNRTLQHCLKQQQHYTETVVHQSWQQQRTELSELHHRLESQGIIIAEQTQRLANADILVKDLYVENSQLSAAVQRLEQQRSRNSLILQHQGLTGVPGMPSI